MAVLLVGGAGYAGSHILKALREAGTDAVVFDNLESGHREAVGDTAFFQGDLRVKADTQKVFKKHAIHAVIHCAECSSVGQSMEMPGRYYETNLAGTLNLVTAMKDAGVTRLVFSSSSAVYGEPERIPIDEEHPQNPASVYGQTKLCAEKLLAWFDRIHGMRNVVLRCCNAAGADPSGAIGKLHAAEGRLIPLAIATARGLRENIPVFGNDYPTRDGSCVRDYVHVCDLADAHLLALDWLGSDNPSATFNIGSGSGVSVLEVIEEVERATGTKIARRVEPPRPGDPAIIIAGVRKAGSELGWQPKFKKFSAVIETALAWHDGMAAAGP